MESIILFITVLGALITIALIVLLVFSINDICKDNFSNQSLDLKKLDFIHIPKTGGGTIVEWGKKHGLGWDRSPYVMGSKINSRDSGNHAVAKYRNIPSGIKTFCVVRDPYKKFLSAINMSAATYKEKDKAPRYDGKMEINKWIQSNLKNESKVQTNNNVQYSWHWVPQHEFVYNSDTGKKICKHILHNENLEQEFSKFIGSPQTLEKNVHSFDKKIKFEDLDRKSLDIINEIYKKDFELFGYKFK